MVHAARTRLESHVVVGVPGGKVKIPPLLRQLHHIQICPTDPTADRPLDRAPIMSNDSLTDLCWLQDATDDAEKQPEPTLTEQQKLLFVQPPRSRGNQEGRPQLSFAALIALAIGSTRNTGLTLSGIYQWIEQAFPFFRSAEAKAWRVRLHDAARVRACVCLCVCLTVSLSVCLSVCVCA